MNGCWLFSVLIFGFYSLLHRRLQGELRASFFAETLRCLRGRDYLLRGLSAIRPGEVLMRNLLLDEVRAGRLVLGDVELLHACFDETARLHEDSRRLLYTYLTHMGFVFVVPLLFRMAVTGRVWFDQRDFFEIMLALVFALMGVFVLQREWPLSRLQDEITAFVKALVSGQALGMFAKDLHELRETAFREGFDEGKERRAYLRTWHLNQIAVFKSKLASFENALGPLELFATCFFALLLLGQPLLSHFSELFVQP